MTITHYLTKGPVLSWRLACTHQTLPAGPRNAIRKKLLLQFPRHTKDTSKVTCVECLESTANDVSAALQECPHGHEHQGFCDVCMGRGIWAMPDQGGR